MWGKRMSYALLTGIYTVAATVDIPMKVVQKMKSRAILEFIFTAPGCISEEMQVSTAQKYLNISIYSGTVHNN